MPSRLMRRILSVLAAAVTLVALAGCASGESSLSSSYSKSVTKGYTSGDGSLVVLSPSKRQSTPSWTATDDAGTTRSRASLRGKVVVLNFWYASCPPCRAEASDLAKLHRALAPKGAVFLGVNVRDSAVTATVFTTRYKLGYPSILDADDATMQQTFAGDVPANAVPVTLVLDREGRVAARFSGEITSTATVEDVVEDVLAEKS